MSQDQDPSESPILEGRTKNWKTIVLRAAGFGGGFALMAALLIGAVVWWAGRPKPWSENAITAKPTELATRQVDEEVTVEFHYAFTNNTNTEYTLPSADSGALMRHVPNASSVEKLDGATWDTTIRIPPHQNVGIVFSVPYRLAEFSTSNEELDTAIVPAVAAILAVCAAAYFYFHRTPKLTDKDTIVLADFTNTTGDPVFDGTLRQGLAVQLEQSPFLSLLSDRRIQKELRLMVQPADARLTPDLARQVCERTSSAAVLEGSIASLGTQYVLGLTAKNCRTGDVLDEAQVQAARKEDVLKALSQIASKFRTRVGESLATIEK